MRWMLLIVFLVPMAGAQGLYITDENTGATAAGDTVYTMTDEAPSGEESFKDYTATGFGALAYTTAFEYTPSADFQAEDVLMWTAYISCDQQTAFRPGQQNDENDVPTMRVHLFAGDTEVAVDRKYELRTCDGPDDIWEAVFTLDTEGATFGAGQLVRVENIIWTATGAPGTGAENVYILGGSLTHPSGLTGAGLPGGAEELPAPGLVEENVTDGFRQTFEQPHNGSYLFRFDATSDLEAHLNISVEAGEVSVVATAPDGGEAVNATFDASQNETFGLHNGTWTVRVDHAGFVGTVALATSIASSVDDTVDDPSGDVDDGSDDDTPAGDDGAGNETAAGEDSPGWPLLVPLAVALWLRRR